MINYYCPDFINGLKAYQFLDFLQKENPQIFNPEVKVKTIFGSFPNMIWNGGSTNIGKFYSIEEVKEICDIYDSLRIPLQLTMTNPLIEEKHCYDTQCNTILESLRGRGYTILVASSILEEYLRDIFQNDFFYSRSIINTKNDYNWEEALLTKYKEIVMPRRHTKDLEYLKTISSEYRNRIEILCNDPCPIDCPRMDTHYLEYAKFTLQCPNPQINCTNNKKHLSPLGNVWSDNITYNNIISDYLPLGYTEFKLSGRGNINDVICSLIQYFIKPQYQIIAYNRMISVCY